MKHTEFTWQSTDGLALYAQAWEPESAIKAVVCLIHGLGEHSGRYQHVAQAFCEAGYAVITFDQRGHGKSGGARGHYPSEETMLTDIDGLIQAAVRRYPGSVRFIYGHSLGALLTLFYTLRRCPDVVGVITSAPPLRTALSEQKVKVTMAKMLASVLPTVSQASGLDAQDISHDRKVVEAYLADPLVHDRVTFAMAVSMLHALEWIWQHAAEFPSPLLITHGTSDKIAYAAGSPEFATLLKVPVTVKLWEGLKHETHNEPEQQQVLAYLIAWMDQQLLARK